MRADESNPKYVRGETYARRSTPRFETKPSHPDYTGGGYEHARSTEYREHTPGDRSESVYASIHRLCAVAWCYPDEWSVREILDDLAGKDVHHESGVPWDNREANLSAVEHGRHSEITQTQRLAWATDAKREVQRRENEPLPSPDTNTCDRCERETDGPLGSVAGRSAEWCVDCITEHRDRQESKAELEAIQEQIGTQS